MNFRTCLILLLLFSQVSFASDEPVVSLNQSNNTISYSGELTEAGFRKFRQVLTEFKDSVQWVEIKSKGGEINVGMDFGELIYENNLNLSVPEYCLSSCANYIFTAAAEKRLGKYALIGFHGGASSRTFNNPQLEEQAESFPENQRDEVKNQIRKQLKAYMDRSHQRENIFFETVGVDQKITTLGQAERYSSFDKTKHYVGWYYLIEDLEKLGVKNVHVTNPPWTLKQLSDQKKVFLVRVDP
jgi:hypothetical protein